MVDIYKVNRFTVTFFTLFFVFGALIFLPLMMEASGEPTAEDIAQNDVDSVPSELVGKQQDRVSVDRPELIQDDSYPYPSPTNTSIPTPTQDPYPGPTSTPIPVPICSGFPMDAGSEFELNNAILCYNVELAGEYEINITTDIVLTGNTSPISNSNGARLTINGGDHVIDGDYMGRVFDIRASEVVIADLTIQKGKAGLSDCLCGGGGVSIGSSASVTLTQTTIISNTADSGGGVYNLGTVTISQSYIHGNITPNLSPFGGRGGGIYNDGGTFTVTESLISNNEGAFGAGSYAKNGTLTLVNTDIEDHNAFIGGGLYVDFSSNVSIQGGNISDNSAGHSGGGIINYGTLDIDSVSFDNNFGNNGGGAIFNHLTAIIEDSLFTNNIGYGGGALRNDSMATVINTTFANNSGTEGGAVYNDGNLTIKNSEVSEGEAEEGGGIYNNSRMRVQSSTITGNHATVNGGGIRNSRNTPYDLRITDSTISNNTSDQYGGGFYIQSDAVISRTAVISNSSGISGAGLFIGEFSDLDFVNGTVSANDAGGSGGGFFVEFGGVMITSTTVYSNSAAGSGNGIYSFGAVDLANSIIASSASGADCVDDTSGNSSADSSNIDSDGTCDNAMTKTISEINVGPLQDNGGPTLTHALLTGSAALDAAAPDPNVKEDQRGVSRPQGSASDIGSFELEVAEPIVYLSSTSAGVVGSVSFTDEDIIAFDPSINTWSRYFDGSDVGLGGNPSLDVDAFTLLDDGSILLSFAGGASIPDVGAIDDSDIIRFVPTKIGPKTEGSFEMYFDGSDVGLDVDKEDIDAVSVLEDGRIVISTLGAVQVLKQFGNTLNALDEDLIVFSPTSLGENTSGYFALYFDGSDIGLNTPQEDVWGVAVGGDQADLFLTLAG
ncbi:MAG: choice-of-anchor Q domain-containing protein, partial [Chloroflexota bacterium]